MSALRPGPSSCPPDAASRLRRPSDPPDIVLITVDALRADALDNRSASGALRMPFLHAFAQASVVFSEALSVGSETQLALPALLTGRFPPGPGWEGVPEGAGLATLLEQRGYHTRALVSNGWILPERGYSAGFTSFRLLEYVYPQPVRKGKRVQARLDGRTLVQEALTVLEQLPHPFFLWLHLMDVHAPYSPLPPFLGQEDGSVGPVPAGNGPVPAQVEPGALRRLQARYWESVSTLDAALKPLLEQLVSPARVGRTLTVVTADHGELLGERGQLGHGVGLYPELLRVPLVLKLPGQAGPDSSSGQRLDVTVSSLDVVPTVLDLLGMPELPSRGCAAGQSLLPLLVDTACQAMRLERVVPAAVTTLDTQETWLGAAQGTLLASARSDSSGMSSPLYLTWPGLEPKASQTLGAETRARLDEMLSCLQREAAVRPLPIPVSKDQRARLEALGYVGGP